MKKNIFKEEKIIEKEELENVFMPTNDYVFHRIFGHVGNEIITQGLLNAILDTTVTNVNLDKNPITEKDIYDDKVGVLDVRATLNGNINCDIEMQLANKNNIEERIMYYWSKMYSSSIKTGQKYGTLKKTIAILIAKFDLKNLKGIPKGHTEWKLREKDFSKIVLTDVCEIHIIELTKLKWLAKTQDRKLLAWMKFLLNPNEMEGSDMKDEALKKAKEEFDEIQSDEHEQYLAELRMKHIMDSQAREEFVYDEGVKKGLKQGKVEGEKIGLEKGKIEIAKKLLKNNVDIEIIIQSTGLSKEEIEKLSK